jgi:hypothetical protein
LRPPLTLPLPPPRYFIWANPNLLPSTFSPRNLDPPPFDSAHPAHLEELLSLERSRAAALAKAALSLEARAFSPPLLASVNPFGKAAAQRACESQRSENAALASSLLSPASSLLPPLESRCRSLSPASRLSPATALPEFPLPYLRALSQVLTGGSFLSPYTPAFLLKSQLTAHLKTLAATDDFLLAHSDPAVLSSLSRTDLLELSSARCLGSPALPSPALRSHLASYLSDVSRQAALAEEGPFDGLAGRGVLAALGAVRNAREGAGGGVAKALLNNGL